MGLKIAIDGPAGAGKSTVAKKVAEKLGFVYIDTGAMYRALTYKALSQGIDLFDEDRLADLLNRHSIKLKIESKQQKVYIDDQEITEEIRDPIVTQNVSTVAAHAKVRTSMVEVQKALAKDGKIVMDGRDIGTHVLKDAEVKVFLTASIDERAKRRFDELEKKGYQGSLEEIKNEIAIRDKKDEEREFAPLKKAEDAVLLDTTELTINQVVEEIIALAEIKMEEN